MRGYLAMLHKRVPFEEKEISLTRDKSRALRREVSPTGIVQAGEIDLSGYIVQLGLRWYF